MEAVVGASEMTIGGFAKLGWREEGMAFLASAAKPTSAFFVVLFERSSQIFNFDKLTHKRRASIVATAAHKVGATRYNFAANA